MNKVITLLGTPITKLRPRFSRHKGKVRTYDCQSEEKNTISWLLKSKMNGEAPLSGPLSLELIFFMPIPKSVSRKKREKMISGEIKHTGKPDCDNLIKGPMDCMNTIVYKDDSQVYEIHAQKRYGENPRTEITIKWLE